MTAPNWPAIRAGIFAGESGGDYDAFFGYSNRPGGRFAGNRLRDMTIDQALAFSDPSGPYGQWVKGQIGRVATPMGAYQIVGTTLRAAKDGLGLTGNEKMDEATQDRLGQWILAKQGTGAWEGYKGPRDPNSVAPPSPYTSMPDGPKGQEAYALPSPPSSMPTPEMAGGPDVPALTGNYAFDEKKKPTIWDRIEGIGEIAKAFQTPAPKITGGGPSAGDNKLLTAALNGPGVAQSSLQKRLGFLLGQGGRA